MPSDNTTNQNPSSNTTTTPPPVLEDIVLPPMTNNKPISEVKEKVTDTGSAAPSDDIVMQTQPISSNPRKKFAGGKVIATILGLFLLVGGLGAGVMLTQQDQNVNEKAAIDPCPPGDLTSPGCKNERCNYLKQNYPQCFPNNTNDPVCLAESTSDCSDWNPNGGGGGGICPTGTTYICGTPAVIKCANSQADCPEPYKFTGWQTGDETPSCQQAYPGHGPGKQFCQTNCSCVAPTPIPTPVISASCQNVKAYSSTWTELTSAQLSALKANAQVNFCVTGVATGGSFDKAKFTINNIAQAETSAKRPNSNDFCQLYTIPSGTTSFNITAQIHHVTLGWK